MLHNPVVARDPIAYLLQVQPDEPVHFFCPQVLRERLEVFQTGFDGMVTFAVKANPADHVVSQLWAGGIGGFDVASPAEIAQIAKLCPGAPMHYNNPVRSPSEIAFGLAHGVASWSVDTMGELDKLVKALPKGAEVAVRFRLPVKGAFYDFGAKFGAEPDEAAVLLARVAAEGFRAAMTFHVGTQCLDPQAYKTYVEAAARIAANAGVTIARLNVGGGFPSARIGAGVDLSPYFAAIRDGLAAFPVRPALVCEPGRGLVADAFAYAIQIKSVRDQRLYMNDGIYGGLSEMVFMTLPDYRVVSTRDVAGDAKPFRAFGPTCDSLDQLKADLVLPDDVRAGDWVLFKSMGAYVTGVTTAFNGYGAHRDITVSGLWPETT